MDKLPRSRTERPVQTPPLPRPESPDSQPPSSRAPSGPAGRAPAPSPYPYPPPQAAAYGRANEYPVARDRTGREVPVIDPRRTNEYFVPREGIDREVITTDIERYLGNDARVRTGIYEDPQTRERKEGYFITAYRNLTSAMIADLKADSARWEAERRHTLSRQRSLHDSGDYVASTTHRSRAYYGPTNTAPAPGPSTAYPPQPPVGGQQSDSYGNEPQYRQTHAFQNRQYYGPTEPATGPSTGYASQAAPSAQQQAVYANDPYYQQQYGQPAPGYGAPNSAYATNNYAPRTDTRADTVPRTATAQYPSTNTYGTQQDERGYYAGQPQSSVPQEYATPSAGDPYYSHAPTYNDAAPEVYDDGPAEQTRSPLSPASETTRRERESRTERERVARERDRRDRTHGQRRR